MSTVTVSADALSKAVAAAKNIILSRTTIPVLQCVLLRAEAGVMQLHASNLDSGIDAAMPCSGEGAWAVNFNRLSAFMATLRKGGQVTISGDDIAQFRCGASTARIATLPHGDFPASPISIKRRDTAPHFCTGSFSAIFSRIAAVCNKDMASAYMGGVRVRFTGTNGTLAAMQKVCMARQSLTCDAPCDIDLLVPSEAAQVISSVFTGKLWIGCEGSTFWAANDEITYYTKTIDAQHPVDLDTMIAFDCEFNVLDSEVLASALASAKSASPSELARVFLHIKPNECFVAGAENGQVLCVPVDAECNTPMLAAVSADQFKRVLSANGSETFTVALVAENGMLKMPHFEIKGNGFFGVAMPMLSNDAEFANVLETFRCGSTNVMDQAA